MGPRSFIASLIYIESIGSRDESVFTISPSARIAAARLWAFVSPRASPTPTGPADSVERIKLGISLLKKTSVHGQRPTALASLESYRNESHFSRSNRSTLVRIVWTFEYCVPPRYGLGSATE